MPEIDYRLGAPVDTDAQVVSAFTDLYWNRSAPWTKTFWMGHAVAKCPLDLWTYQEIITETQPEIIIETGTFVGGSALFFATIMDRLGAGQVLSIDNHVYQGRATHKRVVYRVASSVDPGMIQEVRWFAQGFRTMVVLDSLHTYEHVKAELAAYAGMVTPGCYLVVEDTGVDESWGKPAAAQATREYLASHPGFTVDESREKHLLTLNPGGWIKRTQ